MERSLPYSLQNHQIKNIQNLKEAQVYHNLTDLSSQEYKGQNASPKRPAASATETGCNTEMSVGHTAEEVRKRKIT